MIRSIYDNLKIFAKELDHRSYSMEQMVFLESPLKYFFVLKLHVVCLL